MSRIAIAGATGFIGRHLIERLRSRQGTASHSILALTRSTRTSAPSEAVEWRAADLFSLPDTERALAGADIACYLVHSMLPSAQLTQARFEDLDLILADNFARAAAKAGVKRIVYLGGLVPPHSRLSKHLASRLEVEDTLRAYGIPVTAVRAGLVLGPGGSSFEILANLVRRLPALVAPAWTRNRTQPIALDDLLRLLIACLEHPAPPPTVEAGGPDVLTYADMLRRTGELVGTPRPMFGVPAVTPKLSTLWVSLVTGAPRALVGPLVNSLRHETIVHDPGPQNALAPAHLSFDDAVREALVAEVQHGSESWRRRRRTSRDVRSVQRLPLPLGRDARWLALEYMRWLPRLFRHWVHVHVDDCGDCRFYLTGLRRAPLLDLQYDPKQSTPELALFHIRGGLLLRRGESGLRGRLEFRIVLGGRAAIAGIHEYRPALPWPIYRYTQALVHLWVMRRFGRHLAQVTEVTSDE